MIALAVLLSLCVATPAFDHGNQQPTKPLDASIYTPPAEPPRQGGDPPRQGGDTIEDAIPITVPGTFTGTTAGYTNN